SQRNMAFGPAGTWWYLSQRRLRLDAREPRHRSGRRLEPPGSPVRLDRSTNGAHIRAVRRGSAAPQAGVETVLGKPAVRYFRGGDRNVDMMRRPVRAIALLDPASIGPALLRRRTVLGPVLRPRCCRSD